MTAASLVRTALATVFASALIIVVAQLTSRTETADARPSAGANRYDVSRTRYDLFEGDLTKIARVSFTLTPSSAREAWVRVDESSAWHSCVKRLERFVCELSSPVDLISVTPLEVVARH